MKELLATEKIRTEYNADNEAVIANVAAIKALVLTSIFQRICLYAKFQAWYRWRTFSLSVRTSSIIPKFVEKRAAHTISDADQDLTSHYLTLLARNLIRWKTRMIIKHWHLEAERICKIHSSLLKATSRRRYRDISAAFHL